MTTDLHHNPHVLKHEPKYLTAYLEHSGHRTRAISTETQAEMRPYGLQKGHRIRVVGTALYRHQRRSENGDLVIDQVMNEMQGKQFRPHVLRLEVLLLIMAEDSVA